MQRKNKKSKKKISKPVKFILIPIVILAYLAILVYMFYGDKIISHLVKSQPVITRQDIVKSKSKTVKPNYDLSKVKSLTDEDILKARMNTDKINYQGYVSVPSIDVTVPISLGVDDYNLALGAGTLYPNQQMGKGNYVLASHYIYTDTSLLFSPLVYKGAVGQKIYLTDLKTVYEYTTTIHHVVKPDDMSDVEDLNSSTPEVTLITCNVTHQNGRVIQKGVLTNTYDWKDAPKDVKDTMSKQDNRWIK